MNSEFDPYSTWLGIKSEERPLNHYELLGLKPFENRTELIDECSLKRIEHLQDIATGSSRVELSQRVLNQVSAARICLLDPKKRARYDLSLKKQMAGLISAEELIRLHAESEQQDALVAEVENAKAVRPLQRTTPSQKTTPAPRSKVRSRSKKRRWVLPVFGMLVPLIIGIGILIAVYVYITPNLMQEFDSLSDLRQDPAMTPVDTIVVQDQDDFSDPLGLGESDPATKQLSAPLVSEPIFDAKDELPIQPKPVEPEKKSNPATETKDKAPKNANATGKTKPAKPVAKKTKPAEPTKVPRVIASYDASLGNPKKNKPNSIQSPIKQGWTGNKTAVPSNNINQGVFVGSSATWKNGDSKHDGIDFRFKLSEEDLKDMWDYGWKFEVVARPVKLSYMVGWGPGKQSEFFESDTKCQCRVVFAKVPKKDKFRVRTSSWEEKEDAIFIEKGFARVVMVGKSRSNKVTTSVFQLAKGKPERISKRDQQLSKGLTFGGMVGWTTVNNKNNPRATEASIQVRKLQLSVLAPK